MKIKEAELLLFHHNFTFDQGGPFCSCSAFAIALVSNLFRTNPYFKQCDILIKILLFRSILINIDHRGPQFWKNIHHHLLIDHGQITYTFNFDITHIHKRTKKLISKFLEMRMVIEHRIVDSRRKLFHFIDEMKKGKYSIVCGIPSNKALVYYHPHNEIYPNDSTYHAMVLLSYVKQRNEILLVFKNTHGEVNPYIVVRWKSDLKMYWYSVLTTPK